MKITFISSNSSWGGVAKHTLGLALLLREKGHEISIVELSWSLGGQAYDHADGKINIVRKDIGKPLDRLSFWESVSIFHKLKGDVCIFPKAWFGEAGLSTELAARLMFPRYFTIEHVCSGPMPPRTSRRHFGGLIPGIGLWWYKAVLYNYFRPWWPHRVICVSNAVRNVLLDHHCFPPAKVVTVHNGIDSDKFQPSPEFRDVCRKKWGIPPDALIFGSIGRMDNQKGFDVAIELFARLTTEREHRDTRLVLVGNGLEKDALMRMAEDNGVSRKVMIIGWSDRPWEIYPAFDVFIMPSRNEGLPFSLLEAMACGCCPIAMGVGGIPEVIDDPSVGWLVRSEDRRGFYEAMLETVGAGPERLAEIGRKARKRVISNFDEGKQFSVIAEFIESNCAV
jgi:glycosyltransferase involved in cell wall biosynthesis